MKRGDGKNREAQDLEIRGVPVEAGVIRLVGRHENFAPTRSQQAGYFLVQGHNSGRDIGNKDDYAGILDRHIDLLAGTADDRVVGRGTVHHADAAGVDQLISLFVPPRFGRDAVARHTALLVDNGNAPAREPVEQRRFSDVRPAHDGDDTLLTGFGHNAGSLPISGRMVKTSLTITKLGRDDASELSPAAACHR